MFSKLLKLPEKSWRLFLISGLIFCLQNSVTKEKEYQSSIESTKKIIIENWINSFYGIVSPAKIEVVFSSQKIIDLSKKIANEDLVELFYQLSRADFSNIFKRHNDLLQVLEPGVHNFFSSIYDFLIIFPNLRAKYYSDRHLISYLKENFLSLEKTTSELSKLWGHVFNIVTILVDIEKNNVENNDVFLTLKKKTSNGTFQRNLRTLTDYSSGLKNKKLFDDIVLEYEGLHKILSDMFKDEWLKSNNNWLKTFLFNSLSNKTINCEHLAKAKIKAALTSIETNKNMAIKDKNALDKKLQTWKKSFIKQGDGPWEKVANS